MYNGGDAIGFLATACPSQLHDINADPTFDILLVSGRTQIYNQSLSLASGCGAPLLSSAASYSISHVASDGQFAYFTEQTTSSVRKVSLAGGTDTVVVADGSDGIVNGKRIGLTVSAGTLVYAVRGFNASDPSTGLNGLIQVNVDGSNPQLIFNYSPNQAWWIADIAISLTQATFLGAEFRNDTGQPSNNIQQSTWPLGNLEPIFTGISPADEDNTFVAYDDGVQDMCWFTTASSNDLNALNASARYQAPVLVPFITVPAENGTVQGVAFIGGTAQPFPYCSSPLSPC